MAYRRRPPPLPPDPGAILVDGSNVIASGLPRARERVDAALRWCRAFRPDLPIVAFFDSGPRAAPVRPLDDLEGVQIVQCATAAVADVELLGEARRRAALVVSNDRFAAHAGLRAGLMTLQFELRGATFTPYAYATWFRPRGHAVCVMLDVLQRPRPDTPS